ncbi:MAG: Uma2 family endonuclease [Pseudanabaenaceae cyanobacterium]
MTALIKEPIQKPIGEKRITLSCDSWDKYQQIIAALSDRPVRISFDGSRLEIVMPLELHEFTRAMFEQFVHILAMELGLNIKTMGSTTLSRPDLQRGAEPDNAYYIQNQPLVKGRDVDLSKDPPPDLVVEIDITHTDIQKLELYAALGVPEFWRYDGQVWRIYALEKGTYRELENSPTFPKVPKLWLYEFLVAAREDELGALRELQKRVRTIA